jgi:HK97 family phage major capsid protein
MATGTWANADAERRAMSEAVNSAGGYLVPVVTASRVIDLARNQARVIQAGAQTLVMESAVTIVPRQTADPAMTWHSENLQIVDTAPTFDAITFTAKTLPCLVIMSRELVQDTAVDLGPVVTNSIARALALEIDRAALRGSGTSPEPRGVRNTSGVAVTSLGANGANPTWDNISSSVALLRGLNFEPNAILDNARTEMRLAQLKDSNQRYLTPPVDVANLPRLTTNQVQVNLTQGTATTASEIYVGDWSKLWIGLRAEMTIQILHERFADFGQVAFLAWWRGDINVAHPQAFNILTGAL